MFGKKILQSSQFISGAVFGTQVGERVKRVVSQGMRWGKDGLALRLVFEEGEDFAQGEIFDQCSEDDTSTGVRRDQIEVLQNRLTGCGIAVEAD